MLRGAARFNCVDTQLELKACRRWAPGCLLLN